MIPLLLACTGPAPADDAGDTAPADTHPDTADVETADTSGETDTPPETDTAPPPPDEDGDGADVTTDCDDANPWVYPGAQEWCDEVDQDCDGQALAPGVCGVVQDIGAVGINAGTFRLHLADDVTGDGVADGFWWGYGLPHPRSDSGYAMALLPGGGVDQLPLEGAGDGDSFLAQGPGGCGYIMDPIRNLGDADGDGLPEVAWLAQLCDYGIYVTPSPYPTDGRAAYMDDTPYKWRAAVPNLYYDEFAAHDDFGGDLDGDGLGDMVVSSDEGAFDVYFGGVWGLPTVSPTTQLGPGSGELVILEDLDGDGLPEAGVESHSDIPSGAAFSIVSCALLRGADGALIDDLRFAWWDRVQADVYGCRSADPTYQTIGDWDGDARADLAIQCAYSETLGYEHGEVFLFTGEIAGEVRIEDAVGSWVGDKDGSIGLKGTGDLDGDTLPEVLIQTGYDLHILPHELPALRTPIAGLALTGGVLEYGVGDLNDDGFDDLSFYGYEHDPEDLSYLYLGWAIPWGEAELW